MWGRLSWMRGDAVGLMRRISSDGARTRLRCRGGPGRSSDGGLRSLGWRRTRRRLGSGVRRVALPLAPLLWRLLNLANIGRSQAQLQVLVAQSHPFSELVLGARLVELLDPLNGPATKARKKTRRDYGIHESEKPSLLPVRILTRGSSAADSLCLDASLAGGRLGSGNYEACDALHSTSRAAASTSKLLLLGPVASAALV